MPDMTPQALKRGKGFWRWLRLGLLMGIWGTLGLALTLLFFVWDMPGPEQALAATRRPSVTLEAGDGRLLATSGDLYGDTVRLKDLPDYVPKALMAIEDRRFRQHFGIDLMGLARAAWANLTAGRVVQGGSTLTQQLAKNLFLSPERHFRRKVQEALLALWLESRFTKDQLMEIYLNRVYLGAGTYGIDAASRLYFGVPAKQLSLWQAAMLAGLPKAPSRLNPRVDPDAAMRRAQEVLEAMADAGMITSRQAVAEGERMAFPPRLSRDAGWFADWVQDGLADSFPGSGDLVLRTTLDLRLQAIVEQKLEAMLAGRGVRGDVRQGAVVVMEAATGAVKAMAGGRDYRTSQFNRATQARRQPGSSFKPIVYLGALEQGAMPDEMVADTPLSIRGWSPGNGHWQARGQITLEEALAHSVNTAAVRVLARAGGPREVVALAQRLGLPGPFKLDGSIALGTSEVTLLDMVTVYAEIANGGMKVEPFGIARARSDGQVLAVANPERERVAPADDMAALRRMMEAVVNRGTGRAAALPGRVVAGKTGTTQDSRDAWFIGFTGGLVMGVWLGNDDATPMNEVNGGTLPAVLFHDILATYLGGERE
ncbi:PBP1A family penicillin-binding protein [Acetobacteraceae bacterium H6797]|nr:PBP1A family penicillin-binding protein [Acetobacteraceae bacterium H6797]